MQHSVGSMMGNIAIRRIRSFQVIGRGRCLAMIPFLESWRTFSARSMSHLRSVLVVVPSLTTGVDVGNPQVGCVTVTLGLGVAATTR